MIRPLLIVIISTLLGVFADWRLPAIDHFLWDWLRSMRGVAPTPEDIAIVAIDDPSLARLGPFPWPRTIAARALDAIAAAHPKAIALDVLYTDSTTTAEDGQLARSI